jgi:hypothetical protein
MYCLIAMMGAEVSVKIHGTVESILFARAISMAPADQGLVKNMEGFGTAGEPGWIEDGVCLSPSNVGERSGELNERRYRAMKKISFMAQNVNRTFLEGVSNQMLQG